MRKNNFFTVSLNKYFLPLLFCLFAICLLLFSKQNLTAAKTGIALWADSVLPVLLPFFIATELLSHTKIVETLGKLLNNIMRPVFNVPGIGSFALIMGTISGYPVGAKIVTNFRNNNLCTKEEGERLLAFTNNSGPLFIVGTVGISLFGNTTIGLLLLITHILASITVGTLFRFWKNNNDSLTRYEETSTQLVTFSNLGSVLRNSIMNSINTVVMIGGFVVLFSVVISILENSHVISAFTYILTPLLAVFNLSPDFISCLISGMIELTNGIKNVSVINTPILSTSLVLSAFLLGFGGISVLLQVYSITSKSDISIKPYIYGKLLHGTYAAIYTFLALKFIPTLNFDLNFNPAFSINSPLVFLILGLILILVFMLFFKKKIIKE